MEVSIKKAFSLLNFVLVARTIAGCRQVGARAKIAGGSPAPCGRYLYAVSIRDPDDGSHSCGGVLVHPQWVLTTDTCLLKIMISSSSRTIPVAIGDSILDEVGGEVLTMSGDLRAQIISATPVRKNNSFVAEPLSADNIGLLKLTKRSKQKPINLPQAHLLPGSRVVLVGWGRQSPRGAFAGTLNEVSMAVFPQNACKIRYQSHDVSDLLCAGRRQATCEGDEGSALLTQGQSSAGDTVVGLALDGSRIGVSCGEDRPGLFVDVRNHLKWINGKIGK